MEKKGINIGYYQITNNYLKNHLISYYHMTNNYLRNCMPTGSILIKNKLPSKCYKSPKMNCLGQG